MVICDTRETLPAPLENAQTWCWTGGQGHEHAVVGAGTGGATLGNEHADNVDRDGVVAPLGDAYLLTHRTAAIREQLLRHNATKHGYPTTPDLLTNWPPLVHTWLSPDGPSGCVPAPGTTERGSWGKCKPDNKLRALTMDRQCRRD